jgi:hypothetical protein
MAETNAVDTLLVRSDGEVERLAACGPPLGALPACAAVPAGRRGVTVGLRGRVSGARRSSRPAEA